MKTSEIIMSLTKAIAANRGVDREFLLAAENAMFRLYEFTHLEGVIQDDDIDAIADCASMWEVDFGLDGYPRVLVDRPEVRKMVRDAIKTAVTNLDVRKEYSSAS